MMVNDAPDARRAVLILIDGARPDVLQTLLDRGDMPHLASISVADHKIDQFSTPAAAVAPAWSPKADVIAYLEPTTLPGQTQSTPGVSILRLALVDGNGQRLYPDLPNQQFPNGFLAWSPDGKRVAAVSAPAAAVSSVWIVEPGAREPYKKLADFRPRCSG